MALSYIARASSNRPVASNIRPLYRREHENKRYAISKSEFPKWRIAKGEFVLQLLLESVAAIIGPKNSKVLLTFQTLSVEWAWA